MKTKYILPIALVLVPTMGVVMTFSGTWLPRVDSQQGFDYSDKVSEQESVYAGLVENSQKADKAHSDAIALEKSTGATAESAKQSECAQQIVLVNTKLSELGNSNPEEKQRLEGVKLDAQTCLIVHTSAVFNQ